jgi:hypothetical protein
MKLKWIYWVSTGLLAAIYLGGGTLYLSNISGITSRNKCDSKMEAGIGVSEVEKQAAGAGEDA